MILRTKEDVIKYMRDESPTQLQLSKLLNDSTITPYSLFSSLEGSNSRDKAKRLLEEYNSIPSTDMAKDVEWVFPKKWCIKPKNKEERDWLKKQDFNTNNFSFKDKDQYYLFNPKKKSNFDIENSIKPGYTEVTLQQLQAHYDKPKHTYKDYKEGDWVVIGIPKNSEFYSTSHWFSDGEVVKLGGRFWTGSIQNSFDAITKNDLDGGGMKQDFENNYTIRHTTEEEKINSPLYKKLNKDKSILSFDDLESGKLYYEIHPDQIDDGLLLGSKSTDNSIFIFETDKEEYDLVCREGGDLNYDLTPVNDNSTFRKATREEEKVFHWVKDKGSISIDRIEEMLEGDSKPKVKTSEEQFSDLIVGEYYLMELKDKDPFYTTIFYNTGDPRTIRVVWQDKSTSSLTNSYFENKYKERTFKPASASDIKYYQSIYPKKIKEELGSKYVEYENLVVGEFYIMEDILPELNTIFRYKNSLENIKCLYRDKSTVNIKDDKNYFSKHYKSRKFFKALPEDIEYYQSKIKEIMPPEQPKEQLLSYKDLIEGEYYVLIRQDPQFDKTFVKGKDFYCYPEADTLYDKGLINYTHFDSIYRKATEKEKEDLQRLIKGKSITKIKKESSSPTSTVGIVKKGSIRKRPKLIILK